MKHLCGSCRKISIGDEAVASIENRLSHGDVVYVLREQHVPGIEYLRSSMEGTPGKKPCHLCALIFRSLKDPLNIGTSEEDSGLPNGPISLDISIREDEIMLIARAGSTLGSPLTVSVGSDESCRGAQVSTASDSDEVFAKILAWCSDCSDQHEQCSSTNNKETWLPSRVIDVGPPGGQPELLLRDTRGCTGRYITLTHRWTSLTEASGTTNSNFNKRTVSIHIKELSETFQDAVEVTRKLGIRYLWIDALCIIQDNQKDWRTEAKNMASIYELAWLNIASAGSETTEGRLFMKRDSRSSRPCRLPTTFSKLSHIQPNCLGEDAYAYLGSDFYAQSVFAGFLSRRGWILQERLLSPRTVYFSKDEIYWECNHMIASESVPWGWENHTLMAKINSHFRQLKENQVEVRGDPKPGIPAGEIRPDLVTDKKRLCVAIQLTPLASLYEYWCKLVEAYSNKKLTVDMDKLPAIHGIAQTLHRSRMAHQTFEECYYNGNWTADLTRELLWIGEPGEPSLNYVVTNSIRLFVDRMPTYTWASCRTPVKFLLARSPTFSHVESIHPLPDEQEVRSEWMDRVSSEYLTLPNFTTKTPRGSLQVDGQLEIGTLHMDAPELINQSDLISGLLTFQGHESLTPDTILDGSCMVDGALRWLEISNGTVWCLAIATTDEAKLSDAIHWPMSSTRSTGSSSSFECTLGLILIPTAEFLQSLANSRRKLGQDVQVPSWWDSWYLIKTPVSFRRIGVYKSCDHPPPNTSTTTIVLA